MKNKTDIFMNVFCIFLFLFPPPHMYVYVYVNVYYTIKRWKFTVSDATSRQR